MMQAVIKKNSLTDKSNYIATVRAFFVVYNWVSYGSISCMGSQTDEKCSVPEGLLHVNQEFPKLDPHSHEKKISRTKGFQQTNLKLTVFALKWLKNGITMILKIRS